MCTNTSSRRETHGCCQGLSTTEVALGSCTTQDVAAGHNPSQSKAKRQALPLVPGVGGQLDKHLTARRRELDPQLAIPVSDDGNSSLATIPRMCCEQRDGLLLARRVCADTAVWHRLAAVRPAPSIAPRTLTLRAGPLITSASSS